jgi:hypothetical protein
VVVEVEDVVVVEGSVLGAAIVSTGVSPTTALQAVIAKTARSERSTDLMGREGRLSPDAPLIDEVARRWPDSQNRVSGSAFSRSSGPLLLTEFTSFDTGCSMIRSGSIGWSMPATASGS